MKKDFLKKGAALLIAFVMMMGVLVMTVGAETTAAETPVENQEPYVIIPAAEMEEKLDANTVSSAELVNADGMTLLRLSVTQESNDPYVAFNLEGKYSADAYKYAMLLVRSDIQNNNTMFEMFYRTEAVGKTFKGGHSGTARYMKMSSWQFLTFDFTEKETWTGNLEEVRYDFFSGAGANWPVGSNCEIAGLVLGSDVESLYDAANELLLQVCPPVQQISDFTEEDITHLSSPTIKTGVSLKDGNVLYLSMADSEGDRGDPSAVFNYDTLAKARGIRLLTTDDFRYTVIRYRTSMTIPIPSCSMELIVMTGGTKDLWKMIRVDGTPTCHSGDEKYQNTRTWRGVMVDMAEDDGLKENTGLKYGWQGRGEFNGFRFDWCVKGAEGAYMEVSEFLFFASKSDAQIFTNALNTMNVPLPIDVEEIEKETYETEHVVMPWETETETETETVTETLPVFVEDTTEQVTEEIIETETDVTEIVETETVETETEDETQGSVGTEDFGGIDISGGEDTVEDKGSETPFLIACIALICLSIASIVTVIVIRAKEKA